jgi:putative FmdB family regulatory protein
MPIYEYECPYCGKTDEVMMLSPGKKRYQKIICPSCGYEMVKVMSAPAIVKVN